ncbi:hypothetical protein JOM56_002089 [Amanita muscaria]
MSFLLASQPLYIIPQCLPLAKRGFLHIVTGPGSEYLAQHSNVTMAAQQPNYATISNHLQGLANEIVLLPNVAPAAPITLAQFQHLMEQMQQNIQHSMEQMQQNIQHSMEQTQQNIQHSMEQTQQNIQQNIQQLRNELVARFDHIPLQLYNSKLPSSSPLQYPPGVFQTFMPVSKADLERLTAQQCQQTADALGLLALPHAAPVADRRRQIQTFLGAI